MVKVTFLLVREFLMMLTCHVQIVSLQKGLKVQPLPLDLGIQFHVMFFQQGKNAGISTKFSCPQIHRKKKKSAFINTTLVLTGWSLLTLMSLKSYLQRTSVKAEVRYASALNPLALNPAKLSLLFLNQGRKPKREHAMEQGTTSRADPMQ